MLSFNDPKMSKEKKALVKKAKSNTTVKTVSGQLTAALSSLKSGLGEKKFKKRIKKAAKLMIAGIKATPAKKAAVKAKKVAPAKKKAVKKAAKKKK